MKACSPGVVPSSCSSSSLPWDSDARQASSASNVGLPHSSFRCTTSTSSSSLSPVGCPLSLSVTVSNPSFFRIAHRRRKHSSSRRGVFVVRGSSSTFEVEEQRESHGFQIAESASREQEEPVVKGRVAWSADGKAKILWAGRKQQDNISELHEGHQSNRIGPQHGPPLPSAGGQKNSSSIAKHQGASAGECNNSISVTSHQGAFAGEHNSPISITKQEGAFAASHRFPERSSFPARKQTERCDPSSVSRLRIELPASKQAAEPDTIRPPTFSVVGSDTASSRNETGEENSQTGSVFTSRLEEILQKFRNRPKWRGKSFEDEGAAVTRESSNFKRREMNGSKADNVQEPVKKGITNSSYEGFIHKIPTENKDANDNFFGLRRDPHGERRSTTGQTNARGHTKESTNFKGREMNGSKVDNVQEPLKKGFRSSSYEGFIHKIKFPTENKDANGSFFGPQRYPHGERRSITGQMNARDRHTSDQFNGSPTTSWEAQRVGLPAPKIHSPVGKGSSTFLGRQAVKTGSSKYYPKNASWESKAGAWGTATEKPETKRERRMRTVSQIPDAQKHARCQSDIDAEGDADIISPFNSDFKDEDSRSVQNEETVGQMPDSSVGIRTHRSEPLVKEGKASWHSYPTSNLPFEFQYSYSEAPNAPIVRYREKPFSPFGPETLPRPWTGGRPLEKSKKNLPVFDSFNPPPKGKKGIKYVQDPGPYPQGKGPKPARSRDEILGEPLTTEEIVQLVDGCQNENRQLNLGRDGLTHNMLDLIHSHWKRRRVVKIRCLGVPTLDMDNVCFHLEDKTGGKIIFRAGGVVYLFRGRNYNYKDRPHIPLMLWKPPTPVYPKLIRRAPEGLTIEEADQLRQLGQKLEPLCSLGKNGVYLTLVSDVRAAFKIDKVVRIDCRGLNPSDYKKIGAKLKDLVPCVLLSFDDEQILIWKGKETGSIHVGALNGKEAAEGSTQESSVPQAESASIGMNDLRVEACADIPMNGNGSTQESSVPQLGSASIGMNDLRVEACADIPMNDCINHLWDEAIASGTAIQLQEVEMDHDIVVKKACELASVVPDGEEYTKQLMRKLRLRTERIPRPDDEMRMHFRKLQKLKNEKMLSKRIFRTRTGSQPEGLRSEVPQNSGMPVDELARLLSIK